MLIPGAYLAVAYASGFVSCWVILSSHRVAHLEIPGLKVRAKQLCMDVNGKILIGACINRRPRNLVVVCIDFRDRAHISVSHVISPAMNDTCFRPSSFFINPRGMGFIEVSKIVFWCMDPDVAVPTTSQPLQRTLKTRCLPLGRSICVLGYTHKWNGIVQIIPHSVSNSDRADIHPVSSTALLGISADHRVWTSSIERPPWIFSPHYGIFAVTSRVCSNTAGAVTLSRTMIYFRPGRVIHGEVEFGEVCVYKHHGSASHIAVGTSGTYVALLFARWPPRDHESYLGLVYCDVTATLEPQATFRMLDLSSCVQLALEDALGLVLLVDEEGEVTILSSNISRAGTKRSVLGVICQHRVASLPPFTPASYVNWDPKHPATAAHTTQTTCTTPHSPFTRCAAPAALTYDTWTSSQTHTRDTASGHKGLLYVPEDWQVHLVIRILRGFDSIFLAGGGNAVTHFNNYSPGVVRVFGTLHNLAIDVSEIFYHSVPQSLFLTVTHLGIFEMHGIRPERAKGVSAKLALMSHLMHFAYWPRLHRYRNMEHAGLHTDTRLKCIVFLSWY
ncbi:hypothetical protein DFH08DRAFT_1079126 [Mycena albidolilacea]|uniref:Uncharacterized protein n=1 Tax=Mycena albidolilacea TaxID=1033008 RepID=A0AAD7A5A3_9AGAR|nr:hypothetical protein DFH08DRAFT_1079126 [Mycena albidolilacea]